MDINTVFLLSMIAISFSVIILVIWTLFEFNKLDKEQFKFLIIGLLFYGITVICFFLRYIVFTDLNDFASIILEYGTFISPIFGIFYFIRGTEFLAKQENPGFVRNETLYNLVFYLIIITAGFSLTINALRVVGLSESVYKILAMFTNILFSLVAFFALKLMLEYKKSFSDPVDKIIFQYVIAAALLIIGGVIVVAALQPLLIDKGTITDLSHLRNVTATIGAFIILVPFIICLKSVYSFRKMLSG